MKCIHTFGTDRHKRHADITFLFEYTSVLKAQPGHCISNIYIYLYVSYQSVHTGGSGWGGGGGGGLVFTFHSKFSPLFISLKF